MTNLFRISVRGRRLVLTTALVALGLSTASPAFARAQSGTGAYLAARHAVIENDARAAASFFTRALAANPSSVSLLEQAVLYKVAAGQVSSSLPLAKLLVGKNARQRIAQLVVITDEFKRGASEDAMARLDEYGEVAFNVVTEKLLGGWAAFTETDATAAGEIFAELEGQRLYEVFGHYHAALAASAAGDADAADAAFKAAIGDDEPSLRLADAYGRFLEGEGRRDEAVAIYESVLGYAPSDPIIGAALLRASTSQPAPGLLVETAAQGAAEAFYGLASAFARDEGGLRLARVYVQLALELDPDSASARLLLGNLLEAQERWAEAAETYEAFDPGSPYFRPAQLGRAEAFSRIDRVDDAIEALEALQTAYPDDVTVPIAIGDQLRRAERYEAARTAYDRAFELIGEPEDRHWSLFYARGVCNERIGDWDRAEKDLKRALEFRPEQAHVLNYLGYSWIEQGRNLTEARAMIEKAVELMPNDGYITDSLGWVQYQLGEFEAAADTMERAVELTPTDPVINDHYGDTLWMVGRRLEARFQWRRALSFEPEEAEVVERIKRKLKVGLDTVLEEERASVDTRDAAEATEGAEAKTDAHTDAKANDG